MIDVNGPALESTSFCLHVCALRTVRFTYSWFVVIIVDVSIFVGAFRYGLRVGHKYLGFVRQSSLEVNGLRFGFRFRVACALEKAIRSNEFGFFICLRASKSIHV